VSNNSAYGHLGEVVPDPNWHFYLLTMLSLTTGTAFIMWLGEQITERGIGNGISLIIFAGIVTDIPDALARLWLRAGRQHHRVLPGLMGLHRGGGGGHHYLLRARPAPHSSPVRQTGGGAEDVWRTVHPSAASR